MDNVSLKKVGIIVIGDEILKGQVEDYNSAFLCKKFHAMGVKVCKIATVPDEVDVIAEEVAKFSEKFDFVITTGGIGPTHDDITYEAVAAGLKDKIVLHQEMAEVIRSYFSGSNAIETNPALKMALIPQSSKLIYVSPTAEKEIQDVDRHNGLQTRKPEKEKKSFPIVQVKNVYILPGMQQWLEVAFSHLENVFKNSDVNIYTMTVFLKAPEVKIVKELNESVSKFRKQVIFGSYASDGRKADYQTKITMESTFLEDVISAHSYFRSVIPNEYLCSELLQEQAELVYSLSNGISSLSEAIRDSLKVIEEALNMYTSDEIYLSFNGGKDCTALLHLIWAASNRGTNSRKINTVYIRAEDSFPEVDKFIAKTVNKYNLNLVTYFGPIKFALENLQSLNKGVKAVFMGTRRTDPYAGDMKNFQICDEDWPQLMRVNPILEWTYQDIWNFLRLLNVTYCSLYDEGYTSLGSPQKTQQNPALKISDAHNKYLPAYNLKDGSLERLGRS